MSRPNAIGECRIRRNRSGAINAAVIFGCFAARNIGTKNGGGKFSKASQFVSTTRPIRDGSSASSNWQIAPPVSLPTSVTSASPSASRTSLIMRATPAG